MQHRGIHIHPDLKLDYLIWGKGKKALLALHGYGLDGSCFQHLNSLSDRYTIYSVHLPYHGTSYWKGKVPLPPTLWWEYISEWKQRHAIERYDVLGFSMGGKFALSVMDYDPKHIDEIILIAPDGVKRNFWYRFATHNFLTRGLFKLVAGKKSSFHSLSDVLGTLKLIPKTTMKFAQSLMTTPEDRERGYLVWTNFRLLHTPLPKRLETIVKHTIKVTLFTGKHDRVILRKDVEGLNALPQELFEWQELDCGHTNILKWVKL